MRAISFAITLFASLVIVRAGGNSTDGNSTEGLGDRIRTFLNATKNTVENLNLPDPTKVLKVVSCDDQTIKNAACQTVGGLNGVNICQDVAGVKVSLCTPKVFQQYIGTANDTCGCCGGPCYSETHTCQCTCQNGLGILVNHKILQFFGREFIWKGCYTPTLARQIIDARPEFTCNTDCLGSTSSTGGN